jgi:hypothetical protein
MSAPTITAPLNPPERVVSRHGQEYSDWAYNDPAGIITAAYRNLQGVEFDTFVCRGLSGVLVAPLLARAMSRNFLIVRKTNEGSNSGSQIEGTFGHRWIFLDDFIACGGTFRACQEAVDLYVKEPHELVGAYQYQMPPWGYAPEVRPYPEKSAANWGRFRSWDQAAALLAPCARSPLPSAPGRLASTPRRCACAERWATGTSTPHPGAVPTDSNELTESNFNATVC